MSALSLAFMNDEVDRKEAIGREELLKGTEKVMKVTDLLCSEVKHEPQRRGNEGRNTRR